MVDRPLFEGGRAYSGFVFADYLEKKVANSSAIIHQSWERYQTNNGAGGMLVAMDQVLQQQYSTSLAAEFPKFARNNYFLNAGTYDYVSPTGVYPDVMQPVTLQNWAEWRLFRDKLTGNRQTNWNDSAGTATESVNTYPQDGPNVQGYAAATEPLGTGYIEFVKGTLPPGTPVSLNVTISTDIPVDSADSLARFAILPIQDFTGATVPRPSNQFLPAHGLLTATNSFRIANFQQCDRVALIVNNVNFVWIVQYHYHTELDYTPILPGTPACKLIVQ